MAKNILRPSHHRPAPFGAPRTVLTALTLILLTACGATDSPPPASDLIPIREWAPGQHGAWHEAGPASKPLNLLLISLDTTRQDGLSCYASLAAKPASPINGANPSNPADDPTSADNTSYRQTARTPNLDALATEGILFERGTAPTPITLPSHTTMMTGLYPFHHGVRNNGTYVVPESLTTLAEVLKRNGYQTGAITGAFPVASQFQLDQGFDRYDDNFPASSVRRESDTAQRLADDVTARSLAWIDRAIDENGSAAVVTKEGFTTPPFFLWAHYFDPHYPYIPPEPFVRDYQGAPYAGEIAYMDAEIGRLLDGIQERGLLEHTIVIVAGDHGENLGEHKELTHSFFVYNATQYVPYMIRFPKTAPFEGKTWRKRRIDQLVSLIDILPTALDALGIAREQAPATDGRSLLPVVNGDEAAHDWVYYETLVPSLEYGAAELRALETHDHKYIRAPRPELYELANDRNELSNVAQRDAWIVEEMEADLAGLLRNESDDPGQVEMDPETIEKLRSLGYLAGANVTTNADDGNVPDPKDAIVLYNLINDARTALAEHRPDDGLRLCEQVLATNPDDGTAKRLRASALVRIGRNDEAEAYDALITECGDCPDQLDLLLYRAIVAHTTGDSKDAIERIDALIETDPARPGLRLQKARILAETGDLDLARVTFAEETSIDTDNPDAWIALGELETLSNNPQEAERAFRKALSINAYAPGALVGLTEILVRTNRVDAARGLTEQAYATDPNLPAVLFRKAWFARLDGNHEQALQWYLQALESEPNNAPAIFNVGNIYMQTGRLGKAVEQFEKAIRTPGAPQEAWVNLGTLYAQQSRFTEAIRYWEQALEVSPGSAIAPQIRKNIEQARDRIKQSGWQPK